MTQQDEPAVGETWHILRHGAKACVTLKIKELTPKTVLFAADYECRYLDERIPRDMVNFIERASSTPVPQPLSDEHLASIAIDNNCGYTSQEILKAVRFAKAVFAAAQELKT